MVKRIIKRIIETREIVVYAEVSSSSKLMYYDKDAHELLRVTLGKPKVQVVDNWRDCTDIESATLDRAIGPKIEYG